MENNVPALYNDCASILVNIIKRLIHLNSGLRIARRKQMKMF